MIRDPFTRLPTLLRLWLACALCVLPLGLVWAATSNTRLLFYSSCVPQPGSVPGGPINSTLTPYALCQIIPFPIGDQPPHIVPGSQALVRVFLIFAALILAYAAARRRTPFTLRLVRAATAAVTVTTLLSLLNPRFAVTGVLTPALITPLVWRRRPSRT